MGWTTLLCLAATGTSCSAADDLVIASGGRTDATIVVSPQAGPSEKLAAADLAKYIERMSGARPAVADAPEAIARAMKAPTPVIVVGQEALRARPALRERLRKVAKGEPVLRADAIVLLRDGTRVFLAGTNDESHYYAAAELLARWGCRWYTQTDFGECVPRRTNLRVGRLDYAYAPPFEIRSYWISWVGDNTGYREFLRRNQMTYGVRVPNGHAIGQYVKDLGKDIFKVPIADAATARHVAGKIEKRFADGQYISLGMEDGVYEPTSARDRELMKLQWDKYFLRPAVTDAFLELYNNVCRILLARHPGSRSRIGFLAYSNMTLPPVRDIVAAKPLVAYLAPIDIDPIHGMDDPNSPPRREYKDMLTRWAKVMQGRLAIYDYDQSMLVWRDLPNPSHQALRQDIRHYRKAGVLGIDTECRNAIGTNFINLYLRGRLLWDSEADVDALLAEFYPKFYGPAAGPMAKYWGAIYRAWAETICTEHEYFVAPAIYTGELLATMKRHLAAAEALVKGLADRKDLTRNEKLYLRRMRFTRLSCNIVEAYANMVTAAATEADYARAVECGRRGLAARAAMKAMNASFVNTYSEGENYPWWPGEVRQVRELLEFTDGTKGTLIAKLPVEWAFRRDPNDVGPARGYATRPVDLDHWRANAGKYRSPAARKDYGDHWEMLRCDLYMQAQGIRHKDRRSFTGHAWYRTRVDLAASQAGGKIHLRLPGLFNECWLYVNGRQVAHRPQKAIWWLNDYRFEWDVDLTAKVREGPNTLALRVHCPHHLGGMFRRPFLYRPSDPRGPAGLGGETAMTQPALRSLKPPVLLPDGREFKTWLKPATFTRTYYVDGSNPRADDANPGTKAKPFRTIGRAAKVLRPSERVVVAAGVYRERVDPARGGTGPDAMIGYQAQGKVVLRGSRILKSSWARSTRKGTGQAPVWVAALDAKLFDRENPFATPNVTPEQFAHMPWATRWRGKKPYTLPRGLVFQNGKRLRQVHRYEDLATEAGTYWLTPKATKLYVRPAAGGDPGKSTIEVTTRGVIFGPQKRGLGYIQVRGFTIEHAGNAFPMPQHGALSVNRGHHWLIEDNTVRQVNGVGIDVGIQQYWERPQPEVFGHHVVRRNTVTDCGVCGIAGLYLNECLLEDNVLLRNAFHPVEHYYETGAIKTHHNCHSLIRRNLIVGTIHGAGIWMDFANINSRCTGNVIIDTATIHGGIFIEASSKPNLIDQNVIWGTKGNGIYEHDCRGQTFAHNFIGRSSGAGILLKGKVTDRKVDGQPIVGGGHRAVNNVLIANGSPITAKGPASELSGNLTEAEATLDAEALVLTWKATGAAACEPVKGVTHDFHGKARGSGRTWPGPFGKPPGESHRVELRRPSAPARGKPRR